MSRGRWAALAALTGALGLYTAGADRLWEAGRWPDLLFITLVLFPATLALIWLLLPLYSHSATIWAGLGLAALAVIAHFTELDVIGNFAKLYALVFLGFWFLTWFENAIWSALIAVIIPWVDVISVWRGPTNYVTEKQPDVFSDVAIAFRVPGESGTANLGPPDVLFFALFLATSYRFGLRVAATWATMTALLGATLIVSSLADEGLPALPAICLGFLLPNADLLWTAWRRQGRAPGRIYGRGSGDFYDLDADVIERAASRIVLLTRERPPRTALIENGRLAIDGIAVGDVEVHDLEHGVVVVPLGETEHSVHPEQQAADEDKIERLKRERR